jgi:sugar phosphate isomerase/epimerase
MQNASRRMFLKRGLLAGAAWGLLKTRETETPVWGAGQPGAKMRFGFVTYQWGRDWDLPTLIQNLTECGVLGVELRTEHAHKVEPNLTAEQRREVRKRFEGSPVKLIGLGTNEAFDSPDAAKLKQSIERAKAFLTLGHDVGALGVKFKPNDFQKGVDHRVTIEQIGKSLQELGAFGADLGQEVRLEVHGTCCELPTIQAILEVATHKNVKACWNCNDEDLKGDGLAGNFDRVKKRLGATVHVRELNEGTYPYQDLMNLLVKQDYPGWVCLEARTEPKDRVAALKEQCALFLEMVKKAQTAG